MYGVAAAGINVSSIQQFLEVHPILSLLSPAEATIPPPFIHAHIQIHLFIVESLKSSSRLFNFQAGRLAQSQRTEDVSDFLSEMSFSGDAKTSVYRVTFLFRGAYFFLMYFHESVSSCSYVY